MNKQELISIIRTEILLAKSNPERKGYIAGLEEAISIIEGFSDEPQKTVVPQFVADWLSKLKSGLFGLNYDSVSSEIYDWVHAEEDNLRNLHLAFVYGYEVEKEKRYLVKLKGIEKEKCYLNYNFGGVWLFYNQENFYGYRAHHTRKELEEAGFGWVFDCEGIEIEEVQDDSKI